MSLKLILAVALLVALGQATSQFHLRRQGQMLNHEAYRSGSSNSIGGAFVGFIFGPILFIWAFILIWYNEKKAAIDSRRLALAGTIVKNVNPFLENQIRAANGQLVHVTGKSQCNESVTDPESGITMNGVIKIKRTVQVREMREHGSDNNRVQELQWVSSHESSLGNDAGCWFINSGETKAKTVTIGQYIISQSLKDKLECNLKYTPQKQDGYNIGNKYMSRVRNQPLVHENYIYFPTIPGSLDSQGTLRVSYSYCNTGPTSIISQSSQNSFAPFRIDIQQGKADSTETNIGCCCCLSDCTAQLLAPIRQIDLITPKTLSYQQMIDQQLSTVHCKKTAIRIGAYFLMVFGICAFFSPITTLLGYVPLLGGILSGAVGFAIFLAAVIICIPLFLLAVAVCWLVWHPKVGLAILAVALLILGAVLFLLFRNQGGEGAGDGVVKHMGLRGVVD